MENNTLKILTIMKDHHLKINMILLELKNEIRNKDYKKIEEVFYKFKENLEKHFFEEESVIFKFCEKLNDRRLEISMSLMQEHRAMLNMLKMIEADIKNQKEINDVDFTEMHRNHMNTEEIAFYPYLDVSLSEEQKDAIVEGIKSLSL